jgi:hypothetical protein
MKVVCVIQRVICDYREELHNLMHARLRDLDVDYRLIGGTPWKDEAHVDVLDKLSFGQRCRHQKLLGKTYWTHGALHASQKADLVILEQSSSALHSYPILFQRMLRRRLHRPSPPGKVAYWGHGANLNEPEPRPIRDGWKRWLAHQVDWWFAYTSLSKSIVEKTGFPHDRITVLNNSIDTTALKNERQRLNEEQLTSLQRELFPLDAVEGSKDNVNRPQIGVFCARLDPIKWISFLLKAIRRVHEQMPQFRMIIIAFMG